MKDVLFTPLDIPPIPNKEVLLSAFNGGERYVWWDEQVLLGNKDYTKPLGHPESWNPNAVNFGPLVDHINMHLPFEYLTYVRLARAHTKVAVHVDDNYEIPPFAHHKAITKELKQHHLENEPIGYRIILSGSRDTFYFCKHYDPEYKQEIDQPKHYVTIPDTTDFFLIRNYQQPHGVDINHNDNHRIVGFILGKVDISAHRELVQRSLLKYNDYVLRELA